MRPTTGRTALGLAASIYAGSAAAQASFNTGNSDDIKFQWGVPESSSSSGSGNVYFQLSAPASYEWVGLGIGSGMRGAEIFLMYQDGDGNVTLSPRAGQGHVEPEYAARSGLSLLEGSGVSGGNMVANVRCSDCDSLDLEGRNSWIAAWKSGASLDTTSSSASIGIHDGHTVFNVDFARASISSDSNPFLSNSDNDSSDSGNSGDSRSSGNSGNSDSDSDSGAVEEGGEGGSKWDTILLAHGVIMTIVFIALYPLGALLMPLLGKWFLHAASQIVAFLLMWAGFALGYVYAIHDGYWWKQTHTRLGTIVVALMGLQPVLGFLHHRHFAKHQGRGIISHIHIWYGRILMLLGIINGGLGLQLAGKTTGGYMIAYSVVAAIVGVAYLGSIAFGVMKSRRNPPVPKESASMTQTSSG